MKNKIIAVEWLDNRKYKVDYFYTKEQFLNFCDIAFYNNEDCIRFKAEIINREQKETKRMPKQINASN